MCIRRLEFEAHLSQSSLLETQTTSLSGIICENTEESQDMLKTSTIEDAFSRFEMGIVGSRHRKIQYMISGISLFLYNVQFNLI